jgi:hypothetical protein
MSTTYTGLTPRRVAQLILGETIQTAINRYGIDQLYGRVDMTTTDSGPLIVTTLLHSPSDYKVTVYQAPQTLAELREIEPFTQELNDMLNYLDQEADGLFNEEDN